MLELSVGRCGGREGVGDVGGPPRDPLKGVLPLPFPLPFHGANVTWGLPLSLDLPFPLPLLLPLTLFSGLPLPLPLSGPSRPETEVSSVAYASHSMSAR